GADPATAAALVRAANPACALLAADHGRVPAEELVGLGVLAADRRAEEVRHWLEAVGDGHAAHDHGDHHLGVHALALRFDAPLDWTMFGLWLAMLLQARGDDVLRVKGLLDTGAEGPLVLHGVQHVIHPPAHLDAWPDDDRASRIVLIVRDIAKADVEASIAAFERTARAPVGAAAGRP
ncbi:MAG: GTP-binding protein, partial [Actinomycetota bacterium]